MDFVVVVSVSWWLPVECYSEVVGCHRCRGGGDDSCHFFGTYDTSPFPVSMPPQMVVVPTIQLHR